MARYEPDHHPRGRWWRDRRLLAVIGITLLVTAIALLLAGVLPPR
jgi:hypothetical protein